MKNYLEKIPMIILLDDEDAVNMINKIVIRRSGYSGDIRQFCSAKKAIVFFQQLVQENSAPKVPYLVLLDLNMPDFSGWDFLNKFLEFKEFEQKQFNIAILSFSKDKEDIFMSNNYKNVAFYSIKPLTKESFKKILEVYELAMKE
jgi:response regulator of citrate/malate metabolism